MMFRECVLILLCYLLAAPAHSERWFSGKQPSYKARVVAVLSGDTLQVTKLGPTNSAGLVTVRIADVDAPEFGQSQARAAWASLKSKVDGEHVTIRLTGVVCSGVEVGHVSLRALNLAEFQVGAGWAWVSAGTVPNVTLLRLQSDAKSKGLGVWAQPAMAPWEWRKLNRKTDVTDC